MDNYKKPKVICLGAKARNGKNATATLLKSKLESKGYKVLEIAYANYLKYLIASYYGGTYERTEANRTLWQRFGTEKVRVNNPDLWVDTVIDFVKVTTDDFDFVIVSDFRFKNEVDRWVEELFEVQSVHIHRIGFENDLTEEQRNHPSETALDDFIFDWYIESESGLDKLEKEVDIFIDRRLKEIGWVKHES